VRIFILEDDRNRINLFLEAAKAGRHDEVVVCEDVKCAKKNWHPHYDVVCLDHDLGNRQYVDSEDENTGYQFVKFMGKNDPYADHQATVIVHSYNPEGAKRMTDLLFENGWAAVRMPFGSNLLKMLSWGERDQAKGS